MTACPKCQKKLGWLERSDINGSRIDAVYPEYKGKKLCNSCKDEILAKIGKDWAELVEKEETEVHEKPFKEADTQGRKTVVITDKIAVNRSVDSIVTERTKAAEKFGFLLKQINQEGIAVNMIFEKKEKEQVQTVIDFSSLKDVLSKGGIVMTAYKCPKCSVMVEIPEEGKVLICRYCGTSIKPVDIFEKLKSLM